MLVDRTTGHLQGDSNTPLSKSCGERRPWWYGCDISRSRPPQWSSLIWWLIWPGVCAWWPQWFTPMVGSEKAGVAGCRSKSDGVCSAAPAGEGPSGTPSCRAMRWWRVRRSRRVKADPHAQRKGFSFVSGAVLDVAYRPDSSVQSQAGSGVTGYGIGLGEQAGDSYVRVRTCRSRCSVRLKALPQWGHARESPARRLRRLAGGWPCVGSLAGCAASRAGGASIV